MIGTGIPGGVKIKEDRGSLRNESFYGSKWVTVTNELASLIYF